MTVVEEVQEGHSGAKEPLARFQENSCYHEEVFPTKMPLGMEAVHSVQILLCTLLYVMEANSTKNYLII